MEIKKRSFESTGYLLSIALLLDGSHFVREGSLRGEVQLKLDCSLLCNGGLGGFYCGN